MKQYIHWYTDAFKKYAVFQGKATRQEYWMFFLLNFIVSILVSIVAAIINFEELGSLYSLIVFIPSMAILIRRLHDTNRSAWWALLLLLPIIGWIAILIFLVQESRPSASAESVIPQKTDIQATDTPVSSSEEKVETPIQEVSETKSSEQ